MSTQRETFEDIDLEDAHTNNQDTFKDGRSSTAYPHQASSFRTRHTFLNEVLSFTINVIFPILNKLKNLILLIPACFILAIVSFVSYCTVFLAVPYRLQMSGTNGEIIAGVFSVLFAVIFVISALLTMTSFIRCVFTSSSVRDNPPSISSHHVNNETCRRCPKCTQLKPSRAHHCSVCSSCVLKMDHHCPWVSNCVGYYNYKYFCLFIWFATVSCHVSSLICFSQLFTLLEGHKVRHRAEGYNGAHSSWMMINSLLTLAFGVTLTCFGLFHLVLVFKGSTTIEFGSDGYAPYNLGWKKNWEAIFGSNPVFWFLPIPTMKGDGYEYLIRDEDNRGLLDHDGTDVNHDHDHEQNDDDHSMTTHDLNEAEEISDFSTDLTS